MKKALLLLAVLAVSSCSGGGGTTPPRNLDNACSIKAQKPKWFKAMDRAGRKWGVPAPVFLATIYHESRFKHDARTPQRYALGVIPLGRQSSALGYSQALDGTWDEYKRATGGFGKSRKDFADSVDFMGWYMHGTTRGVGIPKTDAYNQYLAYHEGRTGYKRGSYRNKAWLLGVAQKVEDRAIMYQNQLRTCS